MSYNAYALKSLIKKEHIIILLEALGAHGINPRDTNGIRCSCPIHGSSGSTVFTYNPSKHLYICYGECNDEQKEGDFITLVQHIQKCEFDEAVEYICEACEIDIKLIQSSEEFALEDLKNKIDDILIEISDNKSIEEDREWYYGVKPVDESLLHKFLGLKDKYDFIDTQGFKESTLKLFESCYDEKEERWLLPQRSPEGELLGFDGRDVTNKKKDKWRKRKGLLKNLLLGRLDLFQKNIIDKNSIILCEGIKDQMNLYEAGLDFSACIYGSTLSKEQKEIIDSLIDGEVVIAPDFDKAGYKMVQSVVKLMYPEYIINVIETPEGEDPGSLSHKEIVKLYNERIPIEEWLKKYEFLSKQKK